MPIEPRPLALLVYLIEQHHRVVSKQELREKLWPNRGVTDGALARAAMKLRKAIGDTDADTVIRSVPRVGYRFVGRLMCKTSMTAAPLTLALLPFDNNTGDAVLDWAGLGLMALSAEALAADRRLSLVATSTALSTLATQPGTRLADRAAALQRDTGANFVVHAAIVGTNAGYGLNFRVLGHDLTRTGTVPATRPTDLPAALAQELTRLLLRDAASTSPSAPHLANAMAAEAFARGLSALAEQRLEQALNLFRMALDLEPGHRAVQIELLSALTQSAHPVDQFEALAQQVLADAAQSGDLLAETRVHHALGRFHQTRRNFAEAEQHLKRALQHSAAQASLDQTADVRMLLASNCYHLQRLDEALAHADEARQLCQRSGNRRIWLRVQVFDAAIADRQGDYERTVQVTSEVIRSARALNARVTLSNACGNSALGLLQLGRMKDAMARANEGFAEALALGDRAAIDSHASNVCWMHHMVGAPRATARVIAAIDAVPGPPIHPDMVWRARGHHAAANGDAQDAAACFGRAVEIARKTNHSMLEDVILPWLIEALILSGRVDEAKTELHGGHQRAEARDKNLQVMMRLEEALLSYQLGEPALALQLLDEAVAVQPAPLWNAWASADAAWLLAEAGDASGAMARLNRLPPAFRALPLVQCTRVRVLLAAGRPGAAWKSYQRWHAGAAPRNLYVAQLGALCESLAAHGKGAAVACPPAPVLPSHLTDLWPA